MCSPTEVIEKLVVAYTNDGYVSMCPDDAMELLLRHITDRAVWLCTRQFPCWL
jgi:hypothetical protein